MTNAPHEILRRGRDEAPVSVMAVLVTAMMMWRQFVKKYDGPLFLLRRASGDRDGRAPVARAAAISKLFWMNFRIRCVLSGFEFLHDGDIANALAASMVPTGAPVASQCLSLNWTSILPGQTFRARRKK